MQTTTAATAYADQLAADLRDARNFHDGERCDALDLCPSCRTRGRMVQVARVQAAIPTQRTKEQAR